MRIPALLGLALAATFAAPAFAQSPFIGKWMATAVAPVGDVAETVTVAETKEGYVITGKLVVPTPGQPEAGPGTDVVLEGNNFTYKRKVALPGNKELVITYTGVVDGNKFTGTVDMGFGKYPYNGVRIADSP